jgi:transcriptional regulator with XRE-family HTH domain
MAIAAHLEDLPEGAGRSRAARRTLRLEARGALGSGDAAAVLVHNVSATGLLLECEAPLAVGDSIDVELPHAGATSARVVWTSGKLSGCQFAAPISPAALSAAQLRSAVAPDVAMDAGRTTAASRESFGVRLRRIRKERGLTQGQIAATLGVSKPTVWAWEQGKSRPESHRMEALAQAVGASAHELLVGGDAKGALEDTVTRARERIAAAAGIDLASVRIMIEL